MERKNFYILLELRIDPPETDPKTIEAAISRKQAEWSRLRNHPSKGLQAQKYITLIPEIRRVMSDEKLRSDEARAAGEYNLRDKKKKYPSIDSHIDVLMGKGYIAPDEVIKLSRIHNLSKGEIQDRVNAKLDERFAKIDQQIGLRMAKGYVTELEIERLAKRHGLKAAEVKARIHCPIRKNDKDNSSAPPRQLDRSIEKAIRENLKIIGNSSLYDFLGLSESASLEQLKKASADKKKELGNISRKDAELTAGNTLAGHCMTIFKNEESRNAYDISLAKSRLAELDSDIDISGLNGKIRAEYFGILVKKAMDFGMEEEEAERYIKDYCKRKDWSIELPKSGKRKLIISGAAAVIFLIAAGAFGMYYNNRNQAELRSSAYSEMIASVETTESPSEATGILRRFIIEHQGEKGYEDYVIEAETKLDDIKIRMAEEKFNASMDQVKTLLEKNRYEDAGDELQAYLSTKPPEEFARKARAEISLIRKRIETSDYQELSRVLVEEDADEKIIALEEYLKKHPNGSHVDEVQRAIGNLSDEYYIFIKNALSSFEKEKNWQACADLTQKYIDLYDNSHSDQLSAKLEFYQTRLRQLRVFSGLKARAEKMGNDYAGAIKLYEDYMAAYPEAAFREKIAEEIRNLKRMEQEKSLSDTQNRLRGLLERSEGRFIETTKGVVQDTKTGLMWALIDSRVSNPNECITYEQAQEYVEHLKTGGYSDWRLPTADELTDIYARNPSFPTIDNKWYWSSDNYSSYSDGWHNIVDTVTSSPEPDGEIKRRDSFECGTVRAVRKP